MRKQLTFVFVIVLALSATVITVNSHISASPGRSVSESPPLQIPSSPRLRVPPSPRLLVPPSPRPPVSPSPRPGVPFRPVHTFSIVARDPATGELGVAVQSHWFSVGPIVAWAEAGVGAVATQSFVDPSYGKLGLELMRAGKSAPDSLKALLAGDEGREVRQVAMIDTQGRVEAWTGKNDIHAAGHIVGKNYSVQANLMLNDKVWPAMSAAFESTRGDLAERMLAALDAAQAAGGDIRGKQSAALIVVTGKPTGQAWKDRVFDLRVDDSPDPLMELRRLVKLQRAYNHMNAGDLAVEHKDNEGALREYGAAEKGKRGTGTRRRGDGREREGGAIGKEGREPPGPRLPVTASPRQRVSPSPRPVPLSSPCSLLRHGQDAFNHLRVVRQQS